PARSENGARGYLGGGHAPRRQLRRRHPFLRRSHHGNLPVSQPEEAAVIAALERVWRDRSSVRAFRSDPIDRAQLLAIFAAAQRAPSWCNIQPWHVAVTEPPKTASLAAAMVAAAKASLPHAELPFPLEYPSPYKERRVACGVALYQAMGIARDDKAA